MKKLFTLILLIISINSFAQQTYVPDDNFESWLETNGLGNGIPNDDSVTTANISGLGDLIVVSQGIVDITGIEDFTSITQVIFDYNPVISADLSQNLLLTYVGFNSTALTYIDVSQNSQLQTLICSNGDLTSLNVSNNPLLEDLDCAGNEITALDVTQNTALITLVCGQNLITTIDLSQNTLLSWLNITSNPLVGLDVSENTVLTKLTCVQNTLTSLDVSENLLLTELDCRSNFLTDLDVSQNLNLNALNCRVNLLTALDVSSNLNLNTLNCTFNNLHCLKANNENIFENPLIPGGYSFTCLGNPNLACVEVSYPGIAYNNYSADMGTMFNFECSPPVDASVTQNDIELTATLDSALYQWVDCNDNYSYVAGATNQSFTPETTGNYAVLITVSDECGSTSTEISGCFYIDFTGLEELVNSEKELVKIIDFTGRETEFKSNVPLIFIYSDGSRERVMDIEN